MVFIGHRAHLTPMAATDTVKKGPARSRGLLAGLALLLRFGVRAASGAPLVASAVQAERRYQNIDAAMAETTVVPPSAPAAPMKNTHA